ncbi:MAG: hypothetical protein HZA61_09240 [Candidatus Eisenbacteria bacterium]|uniref:CAF17 C-terminal domain-containing protein n=1 Tax=Eiseniibacteriota bacterium TaxID=2212470 RepID=A0A933SGU3_UNCEI|nr:hypothetical protein [Candidatus Eisenbacteria bacterium]
MRTSLLLTGADTLPLLHRLSTNVIANLTPGHWRATLFCDFRGRLLHRALVVHAAPGEVWLLRDDAEGADLATFIDRYVFREDVKIADHSAQPLPAFTLDTPLPAPPGERARIEAGAPRHGHEIAEHFTPYEVGLAHEVHLSKGCYTGQEALQRLVTYDSARRRLVRITGAGPAPVTHAELVAAGEPAGLVTSAVTEGGGWVGLAAARRDRIESGEALTLADGRAVTIAHVFELTRPQGRPA